MFKVYCWLFSFLQPFNLRLSLTVNPELKPDNLSSFEK
jgi:hypothetical protein